MDRGALPAGGCGAAVPCGVTRARTLPGFVLAGLAWPLSALRGLPWLGRTLAVLTGLGQRAALLRTLVWSFLGLLVFGALFASADALLAEWVDAAAPRPDPGQLRAARLRLGGRRRHGAGGGLPRPQPAPGRPGGPRPAPGDAPLRVAGPGARRQRRLRGVPGRPGRGDLRRSRLPAPYDGADLRRLRPPGVRAAHRRHRPDARWSIWAAARKAPRATPTDRAWLRASLGLLCLQTLVVVASALHRMHVYQEAYGFTQLRLLVDVFEGWLGLLVLAVLASWDRPAGRVAAPLRAAQSGSVALLVPHGGQPRRVDRRAQPRPLRRRPGGWTGPTCRASPTTPCRSSSPCPTTCERCALPGREAASDDWLEWNLGRARAAEALVGSLDGVASPCPESS